MQKNKIKIKSYYEAMPLVLYTSVSCVLSCFKVCDRRADLHHTSCSLVAQHHWFSQHKVPDLTMLPVVHI